MRVELVSCDDGGVWAHHTVRCAVSLPPAADGITNKPEPLSVAGASQGLVRCSVSNVNKRGRAHAVASSVRARYMTMSIVGVDLSVPPAAGAIGAGHIDAESDAARAPCASTPTKQGSALGMHAGAALCSPEAFTFADAEVDSRSWSQVASIDKRAIPSQFVGHCCVVAHDDRHHIDVGARGDRELYWTSGGHAGSMA